MKHVRVMEMAKDHSMNAVNRVEFQSLSRFDDPVRRLAAAIIFQAVLDKLRHADERSYWYYGQRILTRNEMDEEDYRFYADIAGINYSWEEIVQKVAENTPKVRDAAILFCR